MTPEQARRVLQYARLREEQREAMRSTLLVEQRRAIDDPSLLKALFCTRRAGKSWTIGTMLFLTAMAYEGCSCLYLGLTRDTAQAIMNKDILSVLNERFAIGANWKSSDLTWKLPNGSIIYLRGADANAYEFRKIVGQKYRLAVLDEASKFRQDLRGAVFQALLPAMGDDMGTVVLSGTPSNVTSGLFYDVTTGTGEGWSTHHWTWQDNLFRRDNIRVIHDKLVASNPAIVETPIYKQEWLGQWVVDTSALVYRFREDVNVVADLPKQKLPYSYVLGVDLGFTDPSAVVVGAYHEHDPALYVVHAAKYQGLTFTDLAQVIRGLWCCPELGARGPYPFVAMVADAANLQGVEEMRQRYNLPLEAAIKTGKRGVIEAMNAELQTGRVKFLPAPASDVGDEYRALIWDETKRAARKYEEDPRFANHLADAALYMWRKARNYDATEAPAKPPERGSDAWEAERIEREIARMRRIREAGGVLVDEMPEWLGDVA